MKQNMKDRLDTAKYALELSYNLISHYDSKTNQQLTIAGFDFAIIRMLMGAMFSGNSGDATKIVIVVMSVISYTILSKALWEVRKALMPHVNHHRGIKESPGCFISRISKLNTVKKTMFLCL